LKVYLIGSLTNPQIPILGNLLRQDGHDVFEDWHAAGEHADVAWTAYEKGRGHTFREALQGYACQHVFDFDKYHLDNSDVVILVLPAGKSGHLELGYALGKSKVGFILLDKEPEKFDVMYAFAKDVFYDVDELREVLNFEPARAEPIAGYAADVTYHPRYCTNCNTRVY
jgi:hypothetical protein